MKQGVKNIFTVRVISSVFVTLALAVFKPFELAVWQWQAYMHLVILCLLGIIVCQLTEAIMKYVVKMPKSLEHGVGYIIRRNLWFQLINTPLVSLMICLYRHFVLSDRVAGNRLSWVNFFETLAIIAFCSFAIGLYWRFKFRSRFLAVELAETRMLNEQLKRKLKTEDEPTVSPTVILSGTTSEQVTLQIANLLYVESVGNYAKVYQVCDGKVQADMLRTTTKQVEDQLRSYPTVVRCHRAFLVNLTQVEQISSHAGTMQLLMKHGHKSIPVSRSNMARVKEAITSKSHPLSSFRQS